MNPRVSVIMPIYNSERFLGEAIQSILDQTFTDFEFIIIDDASTDHTAKILGSHTDSRIVHIRNEENIGLTASLNKGLALARGEYIARMDADDVSFPRRFEKQIDYLRNRPSVGILGTGFKRIDDQGNEIETVIPPVMSTITRWSLLFDNCLCHSSVVMRRNVLERLGSYCPDYLFAQDYDLWLRASKETEIENLGEVLLFWRKGNGQISVQKKEQQEYFAAKTQQTAISSILGRDIEIVDSLRKALRGGRLDHPRTVCRVSNLILRLYSAFLAENLMNPDTQRALSRDAADKLLFVAACNISTAFVPALYAFGRAKMLAPSIPGIQTIKHVLSSLTGKLSFPTLL